MGMRALSVAAALFGVCSVGLAQHEPVGGKPVDQRVRYDGYQSVRVQIRSQADLNTMHEIGDLWSEAEGVGPVDYLVAPDKIGALNATGLSYVVLNKNVQKLIDMERASLDLNGGWQGPADSSWFDDYKNLAAVSAYVDTLIALRPDLASRFSAGTSLQGRDLFGIKITSPGGVANKPAIVFNGCQHAREWITPMVTMFIADELIRNESSDAQIAALLDRVEFYIVPVVNPDGYEYTWTNDRYWRKNRRGTYGVDLNRNWSVGWGGEGSSSNRDSETYRGTSAFSEPESAGLADFMTSLGNVATSIDFHSYSQLILEPWGYTNQAPPDAPEFKLLGDTMAAEIFSVFGKSYVAGRTYNTIYPAAGVAGDWSYGDLGAYGLSIELRDTGQFGFELPKSQIRPNGQEIMPAVMYLAEYFAPDINLDVTNLVAGQNATLTATNCVPSQSVSFYYSLTGTNHTYLPTSQTYVDLTNPVLIGSSNANGSGTASLVRLVPNAARNRTIRAQAVQIGENSNVFTGVVR